MVPQQMGVGRGVPDGCQLIPSQGATHMPSSQGRDPTRKPEALLEGNASSNMKCWPSARTTELKACCGVGRHEAEYHALDARVALESSPSRMWIIRGDQCRLN